MRTNAVTSELPKCKGEGHVQVSVLPAGEVSQGYGPGLTSVVRMQCECRQADLGLQWVVRLSAPAHTASGMHILDSMAKQLPTMLRAAAKDVDNGEGPFVSIEHTVRGEWKPWRSFTATGAYDLAQRIETSMA